LPKTYKNLYEQIYQYDNLHQAYLEARKDKRYRDDVLSYSANLEENLIDMQNHLIYKSYEIGKYKEVVVRVPKKRIILILPFKDRVLQWAIYRVVNPLFERTYITDSYGCISGRGNLRAVKRIQYWLRLLEKDNRKTYALMLDIKKYFFRVPHDMVLEILGRTIKDERLMWLFDLIVNSKTMPFGLPPDVKDVESAVRIWDVGMPVGSLISQMIANIVLNELDQYVKRNLRVKHYIRYMDNMVIFSHDKSELHRLNALVERFLYETLRLEYSASDIRNAKDGIEFAGYRIWNNKIHLRKSTALRMKRRLRHVMQLYSEGRISLEKSLNVSSSYIGMMSHCNNDSLRRKVAEDFVLTKPFSEDWLG